MKEQENTHKFILENFDLLTAVKARIDTAKTKIFQKRRCILLLEKVAQTCEQYAIQELNRKVRARFQNSYISFNDWQDSLKHGFNVVALRIFSEELRIVMPLELVHEISLSILSKQESNVLLEPQLDEVLAINFFIAKLLSEHKELSKQRIFLCANELYANNVDAEQFFQIANSLLYKENHKLIPFQISIDGSTYSLTALLCPKLLERLATYAKFSLSNDDRLKLFNHLNLTWRLVLQAEFSALCSVENLRPGHFINLDSNATHRVSLNPLIKNLPALKAGMKINPNNREMKLSIY